MAILPFGRTVGGRSASSGNKLRSIRPEANSRGVSNRIAVIAVTHQKGAVVAHVGPTGPGASIGQGAFAGK